MKKEFEEQQKNSILNGGGANANPLQNFDMAAWMAGKTMATPVGGSGGGSSGREQAGEAETKQRSRRRG